MKEGDIIEWRGLNKSYRGTLTRSEEGEWIVRLANGKSFPFGDISASKSLRIVEHGDTHRN